MAGTAVEESKEDFKVLGYLPEVQSGEHLSGDSAAIAKKPRGTYSPEMENALRVIPPKPYTDILVQHYIRETNSQYYCLYPPTFLSDYSAWWSGKTSGQPLTAEFTCLLIRTCACATLFLDPGVKQKLEMELGESVESLSERYHHAAKQLSSTIPPGKGGLTQVQQLFLTASWYKAEALFVESWHALSSAIHEAQELGMHKSISKVGLPEFDREMRRRLWCILYSWDWQMSLMLSRPFIINSTYCSFEMPNVRLESDHIEADVPSPIVHIALQCQLGQALSKIPGVMGGTMTPAIAVTVQQETENWLALFPPAYRLVNPDTQWDHDYKYVEVQRKQLHTIAYMVMLMPLKPCLTSDVQQDSTSIEKSLQPTAIDIALKLIKAAHQLLDCMLPINAKFHFAPFTMFDTAASLCSAVIHDHGRCLPQRDEAIGAIGVTLGTLEQISQSTKTAAICYSVLSKIVDKLSLTQEEELILRSKSSDSPLRGVKTPSDSQLTLDAVPSIDFGINNNLQPLGAHNPEMYVSTMSDYSSLEPLAPPSSDLQDLFSMDLGELGQIWDLENLGLDFPQALAA
ncbi:hypothetical protein CNMCM8980_005873 [Aspergillus fumigatiaffinis]|uniref:Xylanolytic transcriptional activator regulatory domain-containing protein n=1 Tax=Aspergillus fumigatiaffinis TaxID=340414 RepID=A0A8H4EEL1_9EURO|nr:hypothetical protein CNMCM6457_005028 [Aspergillus fumigatiaffinis]KAF4219909.1 hypothetical protein CNMCM5878_002487 [Aspergillus fumigatiaffinis]KAF4230384.1 hypothetical protein CNMCM8980_005873 [Aspergillus fumigatiaffinis]KAF4242494.1 hypothetical protein CNMCM6805_003007 [Aspergillus fumigatiaffinis]